MLTTYLDKQLKIELANFIVTRIGVDVTSYNACNDEEEGIG